MVDEVVTLDIQIEEEIFQLVQQAHALRVDTAVILQAGSTDLFFVAFGIADDEGHFLSVVATAMLAARTEAPPFDLAFFVCDRVDDVATI